MNDEQRVVIVSTMHNRRELSLKCLASIAQQRRPERWIITIIFVDDGSSDGSSDAIKERYPDVKVIKGDGGLYWGGGIELAMRQARVLFDPDVIIWVNDDVELYDNAISTLLEYARLNQHSIAGMTITDEVTGQKPVYGGRTLNRWTFGVKRVAPGDKPIEVDCLNGNLVVIPRAVFEKIGNVQGSRFRHAGGDFDYSLRAKRQGFPVVLLPGLWGRSLQDHASLSGEKISGVMGELRNLFSVKGLDPKCWWNLCVRYSYLGPLLFIWMFLKRIVLIVLFRRRVVVN